jgi:hypothetical protein
LDSAFALSSHIEFQSRVFWEVSDEVGAEFQDLFSLPSEVHCQFVSYSAGEEPACTGQFIRLTEDNPGATSTRAFVMKLRRDQLHRIYSSVPFFRSRGFRDFRPLPTLERRIAQIDFERCKHVGVHIRRRDHEQSITHSPTSAFLRSIEGEIDRDPRIRFYLATDDPIEREELKKLFPGRFFHSAIRIGERDSISGMQDAVVDLFSLARCVRVIGSFGSSFSETAAAIGKTTFVPATERRLSTPKCSASAHSRG